MINDNISILNYNYDDIKNDIKDKIRLKSEWSDIELDNSIVDLFLDMLTYYLMLDVNAFNSMFQDSIPYISGSERVLYDFCNLIGYDINEDKSAEGEVVFYVDGVNNIDSITIPYGTEVSGKNNKVYTTVETVKINNNESEVVCKVKQGRFKSEVYKSSGEIDIIFRIYTRADKKNIKVYVNNEEWKMVDSLLFSKNNDKHFSVKIFYDNFIVIFGNGINGVVPSLGSEIRIVYLETDGADGNVKKAGVIDNIISNIYYDNLLNDDGSKKEAEVFVRNDSYILGGQDREDLISIRNNIKRYFSYISYLWTKEDYENYLKTNEYIMDVKIYNGWELYDSVDKYMIVYCYVVLNNQQKLNDYIKRELNEFLNNERKMFNLQFEFKDVEYIDVICNVYCKLKNKNYTLYELDSVKNMINDLLVDYFNLQKLKNERKDIIRDIYNSDIIYLIMNNVSNVSYIDIKLQSRELLFETDGKTFYDKNIIYNEIKLNYCYLYIEENNIGYFDSNFHFVLTDNNYSSKIIVNSYIDNYNIIIQVLDEDLKNSKKFYLVSDTKNLNDLLVKNTGVVFVLGLYKLEVIK